MHARKSLLRSQSQYSNTNLTLTLATGAGQTLRCRVPAHVPVEPHGAPSIGLRKPHNMHADTLWSVDTWRVDLGVWHRELSVKGIGSGRCRGGD